jgi:predicted nucleotide-binding protein
VNANVRPHPKRVLVAKTLLFLGSSSAAKSQAKAVAARLATADVAFLPWWEAFTPGRTLLEELDAIRGKVGGALLLFSPEAEATVRGRSVQTPNLNVLFEFGYFYGHFKKERVAMLKYGDFYLPSDFGGYIHIFGSTYFKRGAVVAVGKRTTSEYARWLESAGLPAPVEKVPAPPARKLAPIKYPNLGIV